MNIIENPNKSAWSNVLKRPTQTVNDIETTVSQIFDDVSRNGDKAISKYTELFDGCTLASTEVTEEEFNRATTLVSEDLKKAIQQAKINIETFHKAQKTDRVLVETVKGVKCWQESVN